jgi:acyl carrier protein
MEISKFVEDFAGILEDTDPALVKPETVFRDLAEWDSLIALSLIAMADDAYSVKLTGDDIRSSVTINDIFEKVKAKVA